MKLTDYGRHVIWDSEHRFIEHLLHSKYHREGGPAIIWENGTKMYYLHGDSHREDGPAVIAPNGEESYYLHDEYFFTEESYEDEIKRLRKARNMG